jgi:formiminoglutamase
MDTLRFIRADATTHPGAHKPHSKVRRDDPRMASRMIGLDGAPDANRVRAIVLGVADDRGVRLNGGRYGAAEGPAKFRDYFGRLPAPPQFGPGSLLSAGDLVGAESTAETHAQLAEIIVVLRDRFPLARLVVVGGGHDHAFGEVLGLARWLTHANAHARVAVLNVDAHADVRPHTGEPHSGTPFRRLLLEPAARLAGSSFVEWGLQRAANAAAHLEFLQAHGAEIQFWQDLPDGDRAAGEALADKLALLAAAHAGVALSVDLDAFPQSCAPGVSAPGAVGVSPGAVVRAAARFGALPSVTQLGLYELNPRFDVDGATARLAARIAWSYLTGLA